MTDKNLIIESGFVQIDEDNTVRMTRCSDGSLAVGEVIGDARISAIGITVEDPAGTYSDLMTNLTGSGKLGSAISDTTYKRSRMQKRRDRRAARHLRRRSTGENGDRRQWWHAPRWFRRLWLLASHTPIAMSEWQLSEVNKIVRLP